MLILSDNWLILIVIVFSIVMFVVDIISRFFSDLGFVFDIRGISDLFVLRIEGLVFSSK